MAEHIKAGKAQQQGSAVIVALFVLMVICLMGTAVLSVAAVERKVVVSQNKVEMLRQAADAGVQVARNIIMNYLAAGQAIPAIDDIYLENGCRVEISCDPGSIDNNNNGVVKVTSRAYWEDADGGVMASKAARADLLVDCLPDCAVRANTLKLAGRYYPTVSGKEIDHLGNQDWDVSYTEARLAGDPAQPRFYPLNGPSYNSFNEKYQIQHPYFYLDTQQWPGIPEPYYTWRVDYVYASQDEEDYHDLDNSMIHIAPFYRPYGYLEIVDKKGHPEQIGLEQGWNNIFNTDEQTELFENTLTNPAWGCAMSEEYCQAEVINALRSYEGSIIYPEKVFRSQDFIKTAQVIEHLPAPTLSPELLRSYRKLAQLCPEWEYISGDSDKLECNNGKYEVDIGSLDQTYIFVDRPVEDTVVLDFNAVLSPTDYSLWDWLDSSSEPFFSLIKNEHRSVIIISTADLELTMDNIMFDHLSSDTRFYVISEGNINLTLAPVILEFSHSPRNMQAFLWAGEDIHIHCGVSECNYTGLIYAGNNLFIQLENPERMQEDEQYFRIEKNDTMIQQFPESWAYLGMAPIIAYTYMD